MVCIWGICATVPQQLIFLEMMRFFILFIAPHLRHRSPLQRRHIRILHLRVQCQIDTAGEEMGGL